MYKRSGDSLIYSRHLRLADALMSEPFKVETLDGRVLTLCPDSIVGPSSTLVVEGEGMPIFTGDALNQARSTKKRDDLLIRFVISFPDTLSEAEKTELVGLLA